jgi:hypothetical protein
LKRGAGVLTVRQYVQWFELWQETEALIAENC